MIQRAVERRAQDPISRVLWTVLALRLAIAVWGLDRGFELGDEGYFLLNLRDPESAPPPFEFYRLLGPLNLGVVEARALRLGTEIVASLALAAAVFVWARTRVWTPNRIRFAPFLWLCALGSLLSAASRSFGYNDATNFCTFLAAACLFTLAARVRVSRSVERLGLALAAGALTGLQVFVKFPPAIVFFAASSLALLGFMRAFPAMDRVRHIAAYAAGTAAGVATVIVSTGGIAPLAERLAIARQLPAMTGYEPLGLLRRSIALEIWSFVNLAVLVATFAFVFRRARARGASLDAAFSRAFTIGAALLFVVVVPLHPTFVSWTLVYLACLLLMLPVTLAALLFARRGEADASDPVESLGLLLFLAAMPFVNLLGTNVPIIVRLFSHVLPLFAALAVLTLDLRERAGLIAFERRAVALLAIVTTLAVVEHQVRRPYGLPQPIWAQTERNEALPAVRVDVASATFLDRVAGAMREAGWRRGDPIVAFDYMPGLVFLLGGVSPGSNLYMFDKPELNCFQLNRVQFERPPWVILGEPMAHEQQECLRSIRYPSAYRSLRAIPNPYESVYGGFGRSGLSHVLLFAPRENGAESSVR